jgi:uncharacterized protein
MLTLLKSCLSFFTRVLFTALFCLFFQVLLNGQDDIKIHNQYTAVQDYAGILTAIENQKLSQLLYSYNEESKNQIVFAIVQSIYGRNLEEYANEWANKLGIGKKDKNNGIFVLIAMDTRKIRIEIGYGLENKIPDLAAFDIIENHMAPSFKKNLYADGIEKAIIEFKKHLKGLYNEDRRFEEFYYEKNRKWYEFRTAEYINYSFSILFIIFFGWFLSKMYFKKNVKDSEGKQKLENDYSNFYVKIISILFFCFVGLYFTYRIGIKFNPKIINILSTLSINLAFIFGLTVLFLIFSSNLTKFKIAVLTSISIVFIAFLCLNSLSDDDYSNTLRYINHNFYDNTDLNLYEKLFLYPFGLFMAIYFLIWIVKIINSPDFKGSGGSKDRDYSFSGSTGSRSGSYGSRSGSSSRGSSNYGGGRFGGGGASGGW